MEAQERWTEAVHIGLVRIDPKRREEKTAMALARGFAIDEGDWPTAADHAPVIFWKKFSDHERRRL
jgi:hypothetical protein